MGSVTIDSEGVADIHFSIEFDPIGRYVFRYQLLKGHPASGFQLSDGNQWLN